MTTAPAIAVIELDSVALGTRVADAMVKRAPITTLRMGTVQPGKYVILVGGSVGDVQESHAEALRVGGPALSDQIFLPDVHVQVYASIAGERRDNMGDALGVIETASIPANVRAADRAVKTANVTIVEIRLGDGLGGKGLTYVTGKVEDVEAAVEAGVASVRQGVAALEGASVRSVVIPAQHADVRERLAMTSLFFPGGSV